jgi:hypothetical protein
MKNFQLFALALLLLCTSSCKKFLTVEPAAETTAEKLFESKQGFTDALIGVYIGMRKNYGPSGFLMSTGTDYMAQLWYNAQTNDQANLNYQLAHHNYTATQTDAALNTMFINQYNTILNTNLILNALSGQSILETRVAKDIEGQALAIRAFTHFDLIRLFGPMPSKIGTKAYLPYVTTVSKDAYAYETYSSYMTKLSADLDKAEQIMLAYDPIVKNAPSAFNRGFSSVVGYSESFWYYRQNRLNYYAILGLQARVKLWMGDKVNAARYAKMVIDAVDQNGVKKFSFGTRANLSVKNTVFFTEHLFGLNIEDFNNATLSSGTSATQVIQQPKIINDLYGGETSDLRYSLFYSITSSLFTGNASSTRKYADMLAPTSTVPNTNVFSIPMIRLSEMYLIMIECSSLAEANTYYTTYRTAREVTATALNDANRESVLIKEYVKDFYAEGQAFYAYKRFGIQNMLWSDHNTGEGEYVLPLPSKETAPGQ